MFKYWVALFNLSTTFHLQVSYYFSLSGSSQQLLKYNLEKKTSELVRRHFPLVQIVDIGWVGVRKIKTGG